MPGSCMTPKMSLSLEYIYALVCSHFSRPPNIQLTSLTSSCSSCPNQDMLVQSYLCYVSLIGQGQEKFILPHSTIPKQEKPEECLTWENLIMKMTKWQVEEAKRNWVLGNIEWLSQACWEPTLYLGFQFHQPTNALYHAVCIGFSISCNTENLIWWSQN